MILVLGRARSCSAPNLGYRRAVTWVIWCFATKLCTRCDAWAGTLSWWSCSSPVAHNCGLLNHQNCFHVGVLKLNTKLDINLLLYLLSHFECTGHTVHTLTKQHLPPSLTSKVNSSLFTHAHSSPFSLSAGLYWCHTNHSHYIGKVGLFQDRLIL